MRKAGGKVRIQTWARWDGSWLLPPALGRSPWQDACAMKGTRRSLFCAAPPAPPLPPRSVCQPRTLPRHVGVSVCWLNTPPSLWRPLFCAFHRQNPSPNISLRLLVRFELAEAAGHGVLWSEGSPAAWSVLLQYMHRPVCEKHRNWGERLKSMALKALKHVFNSYGLQEAVRTCWTGLLTGVNILRLNLDRGITNSSRFKKCILRLIKMVFPKAPLNICSQCCTTQSVQILSLNINVFLSGRRSPSPGGTSLSRASHPSIWVASLPTAWTLWLPGRAASHRFLAGPKKQASHHWFPDTTVAHTGKSMSI